MGRSTHLLALLQALRRRRLPVTAATLAREMEVSERAIHRDLSELAAQGAPVEGEASVGYILHPGLFLERLEGVDGGSRAFRPSSQPGSDRLARVLLSWFST